MFDSVSKIMGKMEILQMTKMSAEEKIKRRRELGLKRYKMLYASVYDSDLLGPRSGRGKSRTRNMRIFV